MIFWFICLVAISVQQSTTVLAAPPLESCPHDSHIVDGICKCDLSSCSKPPCLTELQIAVNGSEIPGYCCPIYSCGGCSNSSLIQDQCPCAIGAILNADNKCTCVDPDKTLIDDKECVCDPDKCPLPDLCDSNSIPGVIQDGCCKRTTCIQCPDDSTPTNYTDPAIENKCVCKPCPMKKCNPSERAVIVHKGNYFPKTCCDIYKCEKKMCMSNGTEYKIGAEWTLANGQFCQCKFNGIAFCDEGERNRKICHHLDNVYQQGQSWIGDDGCTNCTCNNGEVNCVAHMCRTNKKVNCPPFKCNRNCSNGFKTTKFGCPTCKCNIKYVDLLKQYNITEEQLAGILLEHFRETSEGNPVTNSTMHPPTGQESPYTEIVIPLAIIIVLIFALAIVVCLCLKRRRNKKGSYDTCPPSEPPSTSDEQRVWNNNNNTMENLKETNLNIRGIYRRKLGEILWRKCTP